jgi:O-antigen/teichoic acid export membrane protein
MREPVGRAEVRRPKELKKYMSTQAVIAPYGSCGNITPRRPRESNVANDPLASSPEKSAKSVGKSMTALALGNLVAPLCGVFATPILTHILGVQGRGLVAGAVAPLLLVSACFTFGIPDAITYVFARRGEAQLLLLRFGAAVTLVMGTAASVAVFLVRGRLSGGNNTIAHVIAISSFAIAPTLVLGVFRSSAAGLAKWTRVSLERSTGAITELVGLAVLAIVGRLTPVTATIVIAYTPLAGGLFYVRLHARSQSKPLRSLRPKSVIRSGFPIASFGARVWVGSVFGMLLSRLDQVLMVPLSTARQLGLYAVAVTVSEVPLVINGAISSVIFVSDASTGDNENLKTFARISTLCVAIVGVGCDGVMFFGAGILFGSGFRASLLPLIILTAAVAVGNPGSVVGAGLSARGNPGLRSAVLAGAATINAALIFVLVPRMGATGAALATFVGNGLAGFSVIVILCRKERLRLRNFYWIRLSDVKLILSESFSVLRQPRAGHNARPVRSPEKSRLTG